MTDQRVENKANGASATKLMRDSQYPIYIFSKDKILAANIAAAMTRIKVEPISCGYIMVLGLISTITESKIDDNAATSTITEILFELMFFF